jgi:hypothetical protein
MNKHIDAKTKYNDFFLDKDDLLIKRVNDLREGKIDTYNEQDRDYYHKIIINKEELDRRHKKAEKKRKDWENKIKILEEEINKIKDENKNKDKIIEDLNIKVKKYEEDFKQKEEENLLILNKLNELKEEYEKENELLRTSIKSNTNIQNNFFSNLSIEQNISLILISSIEEKNILMTNSKKSYTNSSTNANKIEAIKNTNINNNYSVNINENILNNSQDKLKNPFKREITETNNEICNISNTNTNTQKESVTINSNQNKNENNEINIIKSNKGELINFDKNENENVSECEINKIRENREKFKEEIRKTFNKNYFFDSL